MNNISHQNLKDMIIYVYDIDVDNCIINHVDWAELMSTAVLNPDKFVQHITEEYKQLVRQRTNTA